MDSERRDQTVENALVHRRPGTWRGVLLCLTLAVIGIVLTVASHGTRGIGIGLAVLGALCAASGVLHLGWSRLHGGE
jgi:drug/metabolite transporter (DMT)-like permease